MELKLQATDEQVGTELKLTFERQILFENLFPALFFQPDEDVQAYESEVNRRLIEQHIDGQFDTTNVTEQEKLALLNLLRDLSSTGKPEIEVRDEGAYLRVGVADTNVYNTLQVNKNERLSSSLEVMLKWARARTILADLRSGATNPLFQGYVFYWEAHFKDLLNEKYSDPHKDSIEFVVDKLMFEECLKGNLSIFEMVQNSLLRVNGYKYTLTSYEPIGAVQ